VASAPAKLIDSILSAEEVAGADAEQHDRG
jgi:hypothetical protein